MQIEFRTKNETIRSQIEAFLKEWPSTESFSVNTSGSTGKPKLINIKREHAIASAQKTIDYLNLQKGNVALLCLSPETIAGKMMLIRALIGDLKLIVSDVNSTPLGSISESEQLDLVAMVPLQVSRSLEMDRPKLWNIRKLIIGGAPISLTLENEIIGSQLNAYQTFGMTETISHVALRELNGTSSIFKAVSNTTFSLGVESNLIIHSPDIGIDNLVTNDIVELIDDESFVWVGRKDNVINTGGVKVHPEQIESKLTTNQNIFISSLPDDVLGNAVILCIEGSSFDLKLLDSLSRFERPKYIYYFESFDYTTSNKINRRETINRISDARKQLL